jgi:serine protease AprX
VSPLVEIAHQGPIVDDGPATQGGSSYRVPGTDHGTHVAGILAADLPEDPDSGRELYGMCPQLTLYDLRVFDAAGRGDEFAILCALEFVGWLNRDRANPVVHGVNLSLALAHDVDSFACGQTPICEACDHLVGAGTVVVAAAGNTGFEGSGPETQSMGKGYRAISITDPGNADHVITVGSTHRRDPHLYGVSYFSARGPTGDGRRKPDLLAPGEKITSTIRGGRSQRMDGTSMAAPHVAGAAALLMARYPELIGRPLRIKEILMQTTTDLKREPSFQGAGLLDVLRALQSV